MRTEPTPAAGFVVPAGLAAALALTWALIPSSCKPHNASKLPTPSASPQLPHAGALPGYPALVRPQPIPGDTTPRSRLADALNLPGSEPAEDVRIISRLLERYREAFDGLPAGSPEQIVNALTGNNPGRLAILPPDHPAINDRGELVDRWGSPFFFHQVSRDRIEIRSAGPDKELFTADDLTFP